MKISPSSLSAKASNMSRYAPLIPAHVAVIHRRGRPMTIRKIAPRRACSENAKDAIENSAVIPSLGTRARQQKLDNHPCRIRQIKTCRVIHPSCRVNHKTLSKINRSNCVRTLVYTRWTTRMRRATRCFGLLESVFTAYFALCIKCHAPNVRLPTTPHLPATGLQAAHRLAYLPGRPCQEYLNKANEVSSRQN